MRAGTLADNSQEMWAKGRGKAAVPQNMDSSVLPSLFADLARVGGRRGRRARLDLMAARYGTSTKTLYRILGGKVRYSPTYVAQQSSVAA